MTQLIGIFLILVSVAGTAWWIRSERANTKSALGLCLIAVFAGLGLTLEDRILELTIGGIGTIKTASEQAVSDAREIAAIRKRIEAQSATVDLVAKEAVAARRLVDELSRKNDDAQRELQTLDRSIKQGSQAVAELQAYTEFNSTVVAAQTDNRPAYDQLWDWSQDDAYPFKKAAAQAYGTIMDQHNPLIISSGLSVPWKEGVEPETLTLEQLEDDYRQAPPHIRLALVEFVWNREGIPKKDRMRFLAKVIRSDESLEVVEYAGRFFAKASGNKLKPLAIPAHLEWWKKNKDSVK